MKKILVKAYEWKELSESAKDRALDSLGADDFSPIPAVIILAIQQKRLFTKEGTLLR